MKKTKSKKILSWTTKDVVLNILVYVLNVAVIAGIFFLAVYLNAKQGVLNVDEYFGNITTLLHFIILLILTFAVVAFYFAFEDRDFLKNPVNSEMLFLIIELALIVCYASGTYVNIYLRPLSLVAVMTLFLTNRRTAIFMSIIFCVLIFLFDSFGGVTFSIGNYPVLIMGFSSGIMVAASVWSM